MEKPLTGRLEVYFEGDVAVATADLELPGESWWHLAIRGDNRCAGFTWAKDMGDVAGDGCQIAPYIAWDYAGAYRGKMVETGYPSTAEKGAITLNASRTGVASWAVRLAPEDGGTVMTGAGRVDRQQLIYVFAVIPNTEGGKSLLGQAVLDRHDTESFWAGSFSWNNVVTPYGQSILEPGYSFQIFKVK